MDELLSFAESRVLGCLLEKEATTPEYYPLTLNALLAACNQKSNRDPVVDYDESIVENALGGLREKRLALRLDIAGSRVPKYRHTLEKAADCSPAQRAVLCVLFLRGPQTFGELRARCERLYAFRDLAEVEAVLQELAEAEPDPLAAALPRSPGKKEIRYAHLFCGVPAPTAGAPDPADPLQQATRADPERPSLRQEVAQLTETVDALRAEIQKLEAQFDAFRKQFE